MNIVKERIKLQQAYPKWRRLLKKIQKDGGKRIFLIGTPVHGNLGDHAIAEEEKLFLEAYFPDFTTYEILMPLYHTQKKKLSMYIKKKDIIMISGGGWMGNLWLHNEKVIREIVQDYSQNHIVILPQTIYYTEDENGLAESKKTAEIFGKHYALHLMLRDLKSYKYAERHFLLNGESKISYYPDMVLRGQLGYSENNGSKDFINVCLRGDCEGILDDKTGLLFKLSKLYDVKEISTVLPRRIRLSERKFELESKFNEFANARLTVTDRLHAMLFSVLNGTRCIVMDNKTGKVFGVAEWLKNSGMIYPVCSAEELLRTINMCMKLDEKQYDKKVFERYFNEMAEVIKMDYNRHIGDGR